MLAWCMLPALAHAQGSIFGVVQNSDLSNPAVGDLFWVGFLDDTDEEIRIETNTGAGYDGLNWYDDFQNYTTEVAGNPYDHFFVNITNGEAFHLAKTIPSNSFQQEDIQLAAATFPSRPAGLIARVASTSRINISWNYQSGVTYHVYRRNTANNGVFRRLDDPTGSLANAGVADSFFVDATSDGVTNYTYLIMGEDASGNYSAHSVEVTASASSPTAPTVASVDPDSGSATGMPLVTVYGTNFDTAGVTVSFGGNLATNVTVVSPFEITCNVPAGTPGYVNVTVTNTASGLGSIPLINGFLYIGNAPPQLASIGAQSVDEGQNLNFGISATDADADSIILSADPVPANATFTDNYDGTGTFDFDPDFTQSGVYNVTFVASDGSQADTEIVAITVNDVNQPPALAGIGPQSVDEGQNLNVGVSASDPDGDSLILTAENLPANASFNDNFDGTGTFDFNPDFTQAGVYNVRFIVTDGALADTELVAITVNDVNRSPALVVPGAQSVDENQNLNFAINGSDPDGDSVILTAENVPANANFTDNGDGTGSFDFNPDFTQAGVYNVRFIASDGTLADTGTVAITVNDVNLTPSLTSIGAQSVDEGQNLNVGVSASDPDGDSLILTAENLPANASFNDNFDGTGTFDFNPDFTQAGVYNVRFIASDGVLADTELVAITVNQVNQAPVLAAIGSQLVDEGQNLNFGVSASDLDGDSIVLTAENVPTNGTFSDNFDGTGVFDFNPSFTQAGVYNVRFVASDGALADTELVAITVNDAGNQAPILAAIGSKSVTEGQNLNFGISASDPDVDSIILSAENVPANATFTDHFDGTGTFDFDPDFTQAGVYNVRFIASDGSLADTEIVAITVNDAGNQAPVLTSIGAQLVDEGQNLNFGVSATDPDLDSLILSAENVPLNATFTDNFDGTGTFDFNPDFTQAGVYNVRFIVSDGGLADTEIVAITVNDAGNQAPVLAAIGAQVVNEGQNLNFGVSATDVDLDSLILSAENVPLNATFTDNFDGTGTFDFNPDFTQAGVYNVTFIVSDGALADTEIVAITVNDAGNQAPVLSAIGAQAVTEGQNLNFGISATDPDVDSIILSAENVPLNATFSDNFDGTGTFDFNPDFTQAGVYNVTFIASDGALADTEIVAITVNDAGNQRPVLASIGSKSVDENQNLNFGVSATDADLDSIIMSVANEPANVTFTDNGDGTGVFDFNPDFTQAGVHNVIFIASDGALADTEIVAITVNDVNRAPVLASIGAQVVDEGQNLNLGVSGSDPDLDSLILTAEDMPANATFTDNFDGTGTFDFNPDFTQAGSYDVRFIVSDGALADTEVVTITVNQVNLAPVLNAIGSQSVEEGQNLNFGVSASDFDGDSLILSAENVPVNATFTDHFDGTGTFDFNPDFVQAGVYNVTFIVSDGALADTEIVAITVNESGNQRPVLASIGSKTTIEGANLNFTVSASDADLDSLIMSAVSVPPNATFTDNYDGTGTFDFNPSFTQAGVYNVLFIASDGALADSEFVQITVLESGNQPPILDPIGPQTVDEGANLTLHITASDPESNPITLSVRNLPGNATFADSGDGAGLFVFDPDYSQAATYSVKFIASDGALADTENVEITVNDVNVAPVIAAIGSQSVDEGQNLNFGVSASDFDGDSLILSAENLPANATFNDNFDGTGVFDFNPDSTQAGVYNVTFIASDGALADTEIVAITVNNTNLAPILASIGSQFVNEGQNLSFGVSASDFDGDSLILSALNVPLNASFIDNFNGTGAFSFDPDFTQAGVYNVTFIASDGALADTEIVAITVNDAGNQAPTLSAIGAQAVTEGQNLNFGISATDPDLDSLILSAENVPANATFTDNYNGTGTFDFDPDFTQAGIYNVTFIASDGALADTEIVAITVNDAGNQAPVLAAIGSKLVDEGQNLNFGVSATDPDLDSLILSAENVPANATFSDNFDGTGTFDFNPDFTQAGVYNVRFIVSDGALADTEIVAITVNESGNQAPVLASIGSQLVDEGQNLNFGVSATDADLDSIILSAENLPLNATFSDNFDGTGTFDFNPSFTQSGVYNVTFIASDGALADTEIVAITVNDAGNQAPILAAIGGQSVDENQNLNFGVSATDADLDSIILSAENVPLNATFADNYDGTGTFDFNPDFTQAGVYNVTFIASDGALADTEIVAVTVNDAGNQRPVLASIGPQSVDENQNLNFGVSATDADLDSIILSAENVPLNATFNDNYDGTGTFDFNPDFTQAGVYNVTFIASDGALADTEIVAITVNDVNRAPLLAATGPQSVDEGQNLNFGISASDPDGDSLVLTAENVPANATFSDNFNGTGTFDFNPDFTQAGTFDVRFIVSDGALADTQVVTITVNQVNLAPTLAAIGSKSVDEGQNLNFGISASDFDGDSLILSAENLPLNATFADNFNGTGTFNFDPDFTQAGVYNVTFIASDGALADTEIVAITVNEAGNQRPVLATIGSKTTIEGANLNFTVSATDGDLDSLILSAVSVPPNATFTDNFDGTGVFDFNPSFTQAGVYNVLFIVSDGVLADSEFVQITVLESGNQKPVIDSIGPQTVDEGQNLTLHITSTDPEGNPITLSARNLPLNSTFSDSGNGAGVFSFNPDYTQAATYTVKFIASDGALADTENVEITVNHVNLAPELASIGSQSVDEGQNLNLPISASDFDGDSLILSAENLPTNATFNDNFDGTGVFDFNPDSTQAGVYNVRFIVSDGALSDTEIVAITVNNTNLAPILASIGSQIVNEGQNLSFGVSASDFDGDSLILSAENLPFNATFSDNFDGTGFFDFNPDFTQAGVYNVAFIVSDGALADTEIVAITVNDAGNQAPVLDSIGPQAITEGQNLNLGISASDADDDSLVLSAENVPLNATFNDNGDGTGVFDFNPDFVQAGVYNVTFIVSDLALADTEIVAITVNDAGNQAPVLDSIGAQLVDEGANLNFGVTASDVDLDSLILSAENLPLNATFNDNFDGTGTFDFNPGFDQAGVYNVTFIASDGTLADTEVVAITVNEAGNQRPDLAAISPQTVDEGQNLNFGVSATDPDGDSLTLAAVNVPVNATFTDNFNNTGTFDFNPDFTQAGSFDVTIIASDGALADTELVAITVNQVNLPPELDSIGAHVVVEGDNLNFGVTASDPDLDSIILSAENLPANATFTDNFDGTGTFDFNPDFTQSGNYLVTFIATDSALADTEIVTITVNESGNQAPTLAAIGSQSVDEGQNLSVPISATDPDLDSLILTMENAPANAVLLDNGDGTGTFDFNPDFYQAGSYNVRFIASDGLLADSEIVTIDVNNINQVPFLDPIGPLTVLEGDTLSVLITASDADSVIPAISAENLPVGAVFADSGNGIASLFFVPQYDQAGVYSLLFIASDGVDADSEVVDLTVQEAGNQPPVLTPIGPQVVQEGDSLKLRITGIDPDGDSVTMTALNLPPLNATFYDSTGGVAGFEFFPDYSEGGNGYLVTFIVSDGVFADSEDVLVSVTAADNLPPVFDSVGAQTVDEGDTLIVLVHATDPEGGTIVMGTVAPLENAVFVDSGNGYGVLTYAPSFFQAGEDTLRILALDNGSPIASKTLVIPITTAEKNIEPYLYPIGDQTVLAGDSIKFRVVATDTTAPVGNVITMAALNLPANATYQDSGNGVGKFRFAPTFDQISPHTITFIATDNGDPSLATTETVTITVQSQNRAPILATIGPKQVIEGDTLLFNVYATDPDSTIPFFVTDSTLPDGAIVVDSGNGVGTFQWIPAYYQSGLYAVNITASDGMATDKEQVLIQVVEAGNQTPILAPIGPLTIVEKSTLTVQIAGFDPDLTIPTLGIDTLIENATFVDSGDGLAVFEITPQYWQDSVYTFWFFAADDSSADSELVTLTIQDIGNQTPYFEPFNPDINLQEALQQAVLFTIAASDSDLTIPSLEARPLPAWATFADSGDGTGHFSFLPDITDSGQYDIWVIAVDAEDPGVMDSVLLDVYVKDLNQRPVIDSVSWAATAVVTLKPGESRTVWMRAIDVDGATPSIRVDSGYVAGMVFADSGNGIATLTFTAGFSNEGKKYRVEFVAVDAVDDTLISIPRNLEFNVGYRNVPPILNPIGPRTVVEGDTLSFVATATDSNVIYPPPKVRVYGAPTENVDIDSVSVAGQLAFTFRPSYTQAGTYSVLFEARDLSNLVDSERVAITVVEAGNRLPEWQSVFPSGTVEVGVLSTYELPMWASDLDNPVLTLSASGTPPGGTYIVDSDTSATFFFNPDTTQADNIYNVQFIASDGVAADTATVTLLALNFSRGDLNASGFIDALDMTYLIDYIFANGPTPLPIEEAGNVDGEGDVDALDLGYLIDYLFANGPLPPPPTGG